MPPPSREKSILGILLFDDKVKRRFFSKTKLVPNDCLEWTASVFQTNGYGQFALWDPEQKKRLKFIAHRLIWEVTNGLAPIGLLVLHKCDNRRCVLINHLFLGTNQDNSTDMVEKNRQARGVHHGSYTKPESRRFGDENGSRKKPETRPRGENSGMSKLIDDQIRHVRRLHTEGVRQVDIAKQFGVGQSTISSIVRRETWGHV